MFYTLMSRNLTYFISNKSKNSNCMILINYSREAWCPEFEGQIEFRDPGIWGTMLCLRAKQLLYIALVKISGARWPSGTASDSESRGPRLNPHKGHCVVSLSKAQTH